ncbi:hypothetical protein ACS0TY_012406 [Phlomoides rotata]
MDRLRKMIIFVLFLFICAESQNTSDKDDLNPLHPTIAIVLIIFSILLFITFAIVGYSKCCQRQEPRTSEVEADPGGIMISRSRFSGIDRTIVELLPFFRFSSLKGSKEGLECAVCLSRFEGDEVLRLLPKCGHAFHVDCIDNWLVDHSSCPLCRNRLNVGDIKNAALTNLEFFIQREESQGRSSRFYVANTFQKLTRGKREEPLIQDSMLHKFKHKVIVSDVIHKSRWSDVNSSDMMSLNSEMLNAMSRKQLASNESISGRFTTELSAKQQILKIKEDMERKRVYEAKIVAKNGDSSGEISECYNDSNMMLDGSMMSKSLDPSQKRSMSEITNVSRFTEMNTSSRIAGSSTQLNIDKDDKVRRLWLPIAKRTIHWFSVQETTTDSRKNALHV